MESSRSHQQRVRSGPRDKSTMKLGKTRQGEDSYPRKLVAITSPLAKGVVSASGVHLPGQTKHIKGLCPFRGGASDSATPRTKTTDSGVRRRKSHLPRTLPPSNSSAGAGLQVVTSPRRTERQPSALTSSALEAGLRGASQQAHEGWYVGTC